jgi:hypothetical protein
MSPVAHAFLRAGRPLGRRLLATPARRFSPTHTDPPKSPRHAHEWVGGVNWYLKRLLRISLDYGNTNFGGGAILNNQPANRLSEKTLISRFQVNFI